MDVLSNKYLDVEHLTCVVALEPLLIFGAERAGNVVEVFVDNNLENVEEIPFDEGAVEVKVEVSVHDDSSLSVGGVPSDNYMIPYFCKEVK